MKKTRKINSNLLDSGIVWVCFDCGKEALRWKYNKRCKQFSCSTVHAGICDVCEKDKPVTAARDFGYPIFKITYQVNEGKEKKK